MNPPTGSDRRPGRPRDESRDADLLRAARDELFVVGYEGMTMDAVAARAGAGKATLYRRWQSKAELVIEAVSGAVDSAQVLARLPDTGSLIGDLHALRSLKLNDERMWRALAGLVSEMQRSPDLAPIVRERLIDPRVEIIRGLLVRAKERGELRYADSDVDLLAQIPAAVVAYRLLVLGEPIDKDFLVRTCEEILVPLAI